MAKPSFKGRLSAPPVTPTKATAIDKFAAVDKLLGEDAEGHNEATAVVVPIHKPAFDHQNPDLGEGPFRDWCIANSYTPGAVKVLQLNTIFQSPFNPRHFYRKESIASLAINLSAQPQQQPIHVSPNYAKPGTYFVHDGGRRCRALREIQKTDVKAIIVDVPQGRESYKLGYDLNTTQATQTVFDNAVIWTRLLGEGAYESQAALAEDLGVDRSLISMTLPIAELPEDLIERMLGHVELFGANTAYAVARYLRKRGSNSASRLIARIIDEQLTVKRVREIVDETESPRGGANERKKYQNNIDFSLPTGAKIGSMRTYGDDQLTIALKGLPKDLRDALHGRFQEIVDEESAKLPPEAA